MNVNYIYRELVSAGVCEVVANKGRKAAGKQVAISLTASARHPLSLTLLVGSLNSIINVYLSSRLDRRDCLLFTRGEETLFLALY